MSFRTFVLGWVWRLWLAVTVLFFVVAVAFVGHAWKPDATTIGSRNANIAGAVLCVFAGVLSRALIAQRVRAWKPQHGITATALSAVGTIALGIVAVVFFPVTIGLWSGRRMVRSGAQLTQQERLAYVQTLMRL